MTLTNFFYYVKMLIIDNVNKSFKYIKLEEIYMNKSAKFSIIFAGLAVILLGLAFFVFQPFSVLAAGDVELDISQGNIIITSTGYTIGEADEVPYTGEYTITGSTDTYKVIVESGKPVINIKDLTVDLSSYSNYNDRDGSYCPIDIYASAECTLKISGTSTLTGGYYQPAVKIAANSTLVIDGNGTLKANGGTSAAGIGLGYNNTWQEVPDYGNIVVNGGRIEAQGGPSGSGIGSGGMNFSEKINITINDGTVTAQGGSNGSGIGGRIGNVTINSGTVEAYGGSYGSGIGSIRDSMEEMEGSGGDSYITIKGGKITAQGGNYGTGIGGGSGMPHYESGSKIITIYDGDITAAGGDSGAGIGGGGWDVIIYNGKINAQGGNSDYGNGGAGIGGNSGCDGGTITIYDGDITAQGGKGSAGIGGGSSGNGGTITIEGGTISAAGGENAAGIGGGSGPMNVGFWSIGEEGCGGDITINGGTITAQGGKGGAGIGGGNGGIDSSYSFSGTLGCGGNITINGGDIKATGGEGGAGIGGGNGEITGGSNVGGAHGNGGNISITGGTVEAQGGTNAAGIGGGNGRVTGGSTNDSTSGGNCGDVNISGGNVTATGGDGGAGIGGGNASNSNDQNYGNGGNVTITDGEVTATGGSGSAGIGGGANGSSGSVTVEGGVIEANGGNGAEGIEGTLTKTGGVINNETVGDSVLTASADKKEYTYGDEIIITGTVYPKTGFTASSVSAYCDDEKINEFEFNGGNSYSLTIDTRKTGAGNKAITLKLTLNDGSEAAKTVTVNIKKADLTADMFSFSYDDVSKTAKFSLNGEYEGVGDITVKYYSNGAELGSAPTAAGTYTAGISAAEGTNYNAADLTSAEWSFTLEADVTGPEETEPEESEPEETTSSEGPEETTVSESETTSVPETEPAVTTPSVPPMVYHTEVTSSKEQVLDRIVNAAEGSEVIIDLKGNTVIDKSIFDEIAGRNITVTFKLSGGAYWTVNGNDIEKARKVNMGVKMNSKAVSSDEIKELAGDNKTVQFSLRHNGEFGFKGYLNVPVNKKYNGKYANLYYYNKGEFEFIGSSLISGGYAEFAFTHASDYVIVISDEAYGDDVSSAAGIHENGEIEHFYSKPYAGIAVIVPISAVLAFVLRKRIKANK